MATEPYSNDSMSPVILSERSESKDEEVRLLLYFERPALSQFVPELAGLSNGRYESKNLANWEGVSFLSKSLNKKSTNTPEGRLEDFDCCSNFDF